MIKKIHINIIRTPDKKFIMSLLLLFTICKPIPIAIITKETPPPTLKL
jgi:hypothetical protein